MSQLTVVCKRELGSYFATPLAYVFILIFLVLSGVFTFYMGGFYESGQADLAPFFNFHPWLYLFLIPALAMRLWAEERKSGTIELLMTLPITRFQAVTGKFLAAWAYRHSSLVSAQWPGCIVLEVRASFRLLGPWPRIEARLREELATLGFAHRIAMAPTPRAARVLAGMQDGLAVSNPAAMQAMLNSSSSASSAAGGGAPAAGSGLAGLQ